MKRELLLGAIKPVEVLVIEDNPVDVELARLLLEEIGIVHNLNVARNGDEAMQYLDHESRYKNVPTPDLVLVDLNLPKLSGFAVLEEVKHLRARGENVTAVVVWSGSEDQKSKDAARVLGADEYFVKAPPGTERYRELVRGFREFWKRVSSAGRAG